MPDCTSASLKLYIPEGGPPGKTAKAILEGLRQAVPYIDEFPECQGVLARGGLIQLVDHDAPWGWPYGVNLDEPPESTMQVPDGVDFDYHTDSKYEITSIWRFRRSDRTWEQPSNQDEALHLGHANLEDLAARGLDLDAALRMTAGVPPPSYAVPSDVFCLEGH